MVNSVNSNGSVKSDNTPTAAADRSTGNMGGLKVAHVASPAERPTPKAAESKTHSYTVRSGDCLSEIAQKHGVGLSSLIAANPHIKNPNLIFPGQHINIPGAAGHSTHNGGQT